MTIWLVSFLADSSSTVSDRFNEQAKTPRLIIQYLYRQS